MDTRRQSEEGISADRWGEAPKGVTDDQPILKIEQEQVSYTPNAVQAGSQGGHGGKRGGYVGVASVIDALVVLGGQLTQRRRYGCGLLHLMH